MANTISSFKALAVVFVLAVFSAVAASARDSEMVLAPAHRKKSLELSSGQVRSEKMKEAALVAIAAAIGNFLQGPRLRLRLRNRRGGLKLSQLYNVIPFFHKRVLKLVCLSY
ncbi:hypothetical protein RHGRI_031555 [Rhododendron griersonianum]|uniref:Uncharacterized protein n=1 Tax=Rhododendron griersonianum TaxID=479676 RepID=A0AAV6I8P7_9ERIC|nr:hypothetical protein RHGRI_031555 [Rhododendron griersonianum]